MPDAFAGPPRWAHQRREYERSRDEVFWALFMEQRTGKTPILIDTVRHLFVSGRIDAQIHLAPNGVHADYVREYLPTYLGTGTARWCAYTWRAQKVDQRGEIAAREALLKFKGLAILSVNIDAIKTLSFRKYALRFLNQRRALASIDESLDIARWTKRTRVALEIGKRSAYRRILDGTPADASPLGMYYPAQFLQRGCFGFRSNLAYKMRYAVVEPRCMAVGMRVHEVDPETGVCPHCHKRRPEFSAVTDYQNIDELRANWARISSRVLREECADMPPKVYERRSFALSKEQRRLYDQMRVEYRAETEAGEVDGTHVLTRMLRMQQITSNYLPASAEWVACTHCKPPFHDCEHCGGYGFLPGPRSVTKLVDVSEPRLDALGAVVAQLRPADQVVIWSCFQADRDAVHRWAAARGEGCGRYDRLVGTEHRQRNYDGFRRGALRYFNADPMSGGRGLDLSAANCVVYYSHRWSLRFRRQSEDRAQNLAKTGATLYVDLVAEDTVDETILDTLRAGRDLAAEVMGDPKREWI